MKCYVCQKPVEIQTGSNGEEVKPDGYTLALDFEGNARIGAHTRSIRQVLCSRTCLADVFAALAEQTRGDS